MTTEQVEKNIPALLLIPQASQSPETLSIIKNRRQKLADLFFDKTKSTQERNAVFDELNSINKYFGYKEVYKIKEKGSGQAWIATPEQRSNNCKDLINFIGPAGWNGLSPFEQAMVIAKVWGSLKS